jgi:primosomal protein N'
VVGGRDVTCVFHGEDEVLWLRANGYPDVPFPAEVYYAWPKIEGKYEPMTHQKVSVGFQAAHKRCHNLSEPRTGKTHSILMTLDYLKSIGKIKKAMIFGTLSTIETVWAQSIADTYHNLTYSVVHHATKKKRNEQLSCDVDIYILNHNGVKTMEAEILKRTDIDMFVWDESDNLCVAGTAMWKSFNKVTTGQNLRVILAGATPTGEKPTDAFALSKLVDKTKAPKYFGAFRNETMIQISLFRWIAKSTAKQRVHEILQPAICFLKKDVLKDLPPMSHERIHAELSDEQRRMFKELQKDMATEYKGGNLNAINGADKLAKCIQVCLGAYKTPEGDYQTIDFSPRLEAIRECIKSASKKILVLVPYTGALRAYYEELKKHYTCEMVDGSTSKDERARIFTEYQTGKDPYILLAHPKVIAHGCEFSVADTTIYAGPIASGRQFIQSLERMNSIKQDSPMMIYYITSTNLENQRYDIMTGKKESQDSVLEMYQSIIDEKV